MARKKAKPQDIEKKLGGGLSDLLNLSALDPQLKQDAMQAGVEREAAERKAQAAKRKGSYFHNPYNFISILPRNSASVQSSPLTDGKPVSHSAFLSDHWTGRIRVKLETQTPLLIPDAAKPTELNDDHKSYPLRRVNKKPYLAPTSIKGMLRSAYEAVTNSRLAIFQKHSDRLAYRPPAKNDIQAGRIAENQAGELCFYPMEAVKLLRYKDYKPHETAPYDKGESQAAKKYVSGGLPQHKDAVWVKIVRTEKGAPKVDSIEPRNSAQPPEPSGWKAGWACVTGPSCSEKKFERVFVDKRESPIKLTDKDIDFWTTLILDYKAQHEKELTKRREDYDVGRLNRDLWQTFLNSNPTRDEHYLFLRAYLGHEPGKTAWSRHVYEEDSEALKAGTLCYAELSSDKRNPTVHCLIPVTISRKLFQVSPEVLLPKELKPATELSELSPADRVFGWVNQSGTSAHKGQIRIHSVSCVTQNPEEKFGGDGLALTILGEPKPTQARFYTLEENGKNLEGKPKGAGYQNSRQNLRGRKVYPHHKLAEESQNPDYWKPLSNQQASLKTSTGTVREYLQPGQLRTSQNRSIKSWVKPKVVFEFDIDVINLSEVELGALLWLLSLPAEHYHRLGGAKSLGFGSVRLSVSSVDLKQGQSWKNYYETLSTLCGDILEEANVLNAFIGERKQSFESALEEAYNHDYSKILSSFLQAAKGFNDELPVHYPRVNPTPGEDEESFKWFTENDRDSTKPDDGGLKLSLPLITADEGIPYQPAKAKKGPVRRG